MNTNPSQSRPNIAVSSAAARMETQQDFAQAPAPELVAEHKTVVGFLRTVPRRLHMDEIKRFGREVGMMAESVHLAYLTTIDSQLGVLRMFPVPLMRRVYDVLAAQIGWQQFPVEQAALPEEMAAELKAQEKLARLLRAALDVAPDKHLQQSTGDVLQWIEGEIGRLREQLELAQAEAAQPAAPVAAPVSAPAPSRVANSSTPAPEAA